MAIAVIPILLLLYSAIGLRVSASRFGARGAALFTLLNVCVGCVIASAFMLVGAARSPWGTQHWAGLAMAGVGLAVLVVLVALWRQIDRIDATVLD